MVTSLHKVDMFFYQTFKHILLYNLRQVSYYKMTAIERFKTGQF